VVTSGAVVIETASRFTIPFAVLPLLSIALRAAIDFASVHIEAMNGF